jgi:two-component system cell cycle sensor histidine kinase/response regulator CckA
MGCLGALACPRERRLVYQVLLLFFPVMTKTPPHPTNARDEITPRLHRTFWYGTIALAALGLTCLLLYAVNRGTLRALLQGREVSRIGREAQGLATDRESGVRGFLLSHDRRFLEPELRGRPLLKSKLDSLVSLTSVRSSQRDRAKAIRDAVGRWERGYVFAALKHAEAGDSVALRDTELAGKELFDSVRAAFGSFESAEERIYRMRAAWLRFIGKFTLGAVLVEILLLLGVLYWLRTRALAQAKHALQQRDQLEEQKAELEAQADSLEAQAARLAEEATNAQAATRSVEVTNRQLAETVVRLEAAQQEARQAQGEREETLSVLDLVLGSSPVGFALLDADLRLTRVNEALAGITGLPPEAHLGKKMEEIASPQSAAVMGPLMRRVLETGEPVKNFQLNAPKASDHSVEQHKLVSVFRVEKASGTLGIGILVIDTTERMRLEEQLLQAQKMEAIGRLAGGIAHDFNNMLTAMKSYCELLLADMEKHDPRRSDVVEIGKAADRATALTRQLLAFSRQQVLHPEPLDLNHMVSEVEGMLRRLIGADTELITRLTPGLGMVTADSGEIQRVIVNLAVNARDAMPHGGKLSIETANVELDEDYALTHADAPAGSYVMLAVSDTGHGMSRETKERLFEPFFTTKDMGKGTGLGLSSVYGIVKQSGGNIWVYSEPEKGTSFKIYLPRIAEQVVVPSVKVPAIRNGGAETILLVEDEESVRAVASRILRREGYTVREAANGADALKICELDGAEVDLIVTDLVMPEMGGAELALRVRRSRPGARILFTSGYTQDAVVRQSFLEQGAAFIEKPFTPDALARKTREVLDAPLILEPL